MTSRPVGLFRRSSAEYRRRFLINLGLMALVVLALVASLSAGPPFGGDRVTRLVAIVFVVGLLDTSYLWYRVRRG